MTQVKPTLLIIRDGWGSNHNTSQDAYNAVKLADTPVADRLSRDWPRTEILAYGLDVGLPEGVMGNSEVGHQNIGAGRIVDQEIVRIDKAVKNKTLTENAVLKSVFEHVKKNDRRLHFIGLASNAGVHSMLTHLYGLLEETKRVGIQDVYIHAITDGRDSPPKSCLGYIQELEEQCKQIGVGKIATVSGRFWAMDRDKRWERIQKAYECLLGIRSEYSAKSASAIVKHFYGNPVDPSRQGDEFIEPSWVVDDNGDPIGPIESGDAVIFYNFRGDRPREIVTALTKEDFNGFIRKERADVLMATMTAYESGLCENVLFPKPPKMKNILGEYVSNLGISQFRCAETEKYPHVTFFFNDYREEPFPQEDRGLVQSPKDVMTYDEKPEMSARGVCEAAKKAILSREYGLFVVNFANPDMVAHTGSLEATKKAVEVVDACVGELLEAIDTIGGAAVITADHGNADQMWNPEVKAPHTQHTLNPVEVVLYGEGLQGNTLKDSGRLADLAPTILKLMGLPIPEEMTGESLYVNELHTV